MTIQPSFGPKPAFPGSTASDLPWTPALSSTLLCNPMRVTTTISSPCLTPNPRLLMKVHWRVPPALPGSHPAWGAGHDSDSACLCVGLELE